MKITMTKRNGFIQLPILAWVGIFVLGALTAGTGAVVISGKSPASLLASISSQFAKENVLDEPELILSEETTPDPIQEELEKAKQEIERLQQEKEEALKQAQQQARSEAELKALSALQKQIEDAQRRLTETQAQAQAEAQAKAEAESKEVIAEPQTPVGLEISSVAIIHKGDFLRIGWKTSKPSESKVLIWPIHEIPSNASSTSTSRSDTHYVDILYNNFPVYSIGTDFINDYLNYNYRIEATSGELSGAKEGIFTLTKDINIEWISQLMGLNPQSSCQSLPLTDPQRLFCKNYRSYTGKGD